MRFLLFSAFATVCLAFPVIAGIYNPDGQGLVSSDIGATVAPQELTVTDKTANHIWALTDSGDYIRFNSSGSLSATVPPNSDVAFDIGTQIPFSMRGGGTLTVGPGSGVTLNTIGSGLTFSSAGGYAIKTGTNTWDIIGGQ